MATDFVTDAVSDDGTQAANEDDQPHRKPVLAGKHSAEEYSRLARQDESNERRGLKRREGEHQSERQQRRESRIRSKRRLIMAPYPRAKRGRS